MKAVESTPLAVAIAKAINEHTKQHTQTVNETLYALQYVHALIERQYLSEETTLH